MTSPSCFICSQDGTVYLTASAWVCQDHWDGTGTAYLEQA